jgi:hypothetical protein
MSLIWATRGRTWGFRFLRTGGFTDPLPEFDRAFSTIEDGPVACQHIDGKVALRFPDPLRRQDRSGRVIPHQFVLDGQLAAEVNSIEDGLRVVWPLVADEFAQIWELPEPPSVDT